MEQFENPGISKDALEIGRPALPRFNLHNVRRTVSARDLYDTETVPLRFQSERFGVDGDCFAAAPIVRQIALVQTNGHESGATRLEEKHSPKRERHGGRADE